MRYWHWWLCWLISAIGVSGALWYVLFGHNPFYDTEGNRWVILVMLWIASIGHGIVWEILS